MQRRPERLLSFGPAGIRRVLRIFSDLFSEWFLYGALESVIVSEDWGSFYKTGPL